MNRSSKNFFGVVFCVIYVTIFYSELKAQEQTSRSWREISLGMRIEDVAAPLGRLRLISWSGGPRESDLFFELRASSTGYRCMPGARCEEIVINAAKIGSNLIIYSIKILSRYATPVRVDELGTAALNRFGSPTSSSWHWQGTGMTLWSRRMGQSMGSSGRVLARQELTWIHTGEDVGFSSLTRLRIHISEPVIVFEGQENPHPSAAQLEMLVSKRYELDIFDHRLSAQARLEDLARRQNNPQENPSQF